MDTDSIPITNHFAEQIGLLPLTSQTLSGIAVLVVLLVISALISGSEVALFSLEPTDISELKSGKRRSSHTVLRLIAEPEQLLAALLVSNNLINIGIVLLSAHISSSLVDFSSAPLLGFIVNTVIITALLLLLAEIIPKVYAAHYPKKLALATAGFIEAIVFITRPVNHLLIHSTSFVSKRLNKKRKNLSINDISHALQLAEHPDLSDDKEILEGIVKFGSKGVSEIMKPRLEVVSIDIRANFQEVLQIIRESGYSRIPVFSGTLDEIKGILYIKDLLNHLDKSDGFKWQTLLRQPIFVPETKKIDDLLLDFQKNKVHMAIVVDEFGGTSGLVTLEDIVEEIVGDIADEFDEDEKFFSQISDLEYVFDGKIMLNDFCKILDLEEERFNDLRGEADTVAGMLLEVKGEFPNLHEKIVCKNITFEIEGVDTRRITKIRVTMPDSEKTNENEE